MTYLGADDTTVSGGEVYFVGPGALFSKVALRTAETELDGPTRRVPDMDALRFSRTDKAGTITPPHMVVVHETCARELLKALERGADYLPRRRIAIAFEREDAACALFADVCDELLNRRVSLLPMNINITSWVRLLQVIQAGGHYVPPEVLRAQPGTGARHTSSPQPVVDPVCPPAGPTRRSR